MTMTEPRDFDIGVSRQLAALDKRLSRLDSYPSGPSIGELYADFRGLPGLRGLWYPGSVQYQGNVRDAAGGVLELSINGNPAIDIHNDLIPYYAYDGTGDFHSRADELNLDISGTETFIAPAYNGLTVGGWYYVNSLATAQGLASKYTNAGNQRSWVLLTLGVGSALRFAVSNTGAADILVDSGAQVAGTWIFIVARYDPSTELAIFTNGTKVVNTTSVPASLFNSTAAFQIGAYNAGTQLLTGRWALTFLCAAALPDSLLAHLLNRTRVLFGI